MREKLMNGGIGVILDILPHRYPFLMIDKITDVSEDLNQIVAIKNVTVNEPFFQGHFPEKPVMPGVMMLEAMAQVSGLVHYCEKKSSKTLSDTGKELMVFMGADEVKFRAIVSPGDTLIITAEKVRSYMNGTILTCNCSIKLLESGKLVTSSVVKTNSIVSK